jgi:hypothetical protein
MPADFPGPYDDDVHAEMMATEAAPLSYPNAHPAAIPTFLAERS